MKQLISALLAVLVLLSLSGCRRAAVPAAETTAAPVTETPAPETTTAAPATTAPAAESETAPPSGTAAVTDRAEEGSVEESVGYRLVVPQVSAADPAAAQTINDYYTSVLGKLKDLAAGEVYEQAMNNHTVLMLTSAYETECNRDGVLSLRRSATSADQSGGRDTVTWYAETFNLANGGLYTLGDFFSVPESGYAARLTGAVAAQIGDDPNHAQTYFDNWETLVVSSFDATQFYVTPDAVVVYYQAGALGRDAVFFTIPDKELADILRRP